MMSPLPPWQELLRQMIELSPAAAIGILPLALLLGRRRSQSALAMNLGIALSFALSSLAGYVIIADWPDFPPRISTQIALLIPAVLVLPTIFVTSFAAMWVRGSFATLAALGTAAWIWRDLEGREDAPSALAFCSAGFLSFLIFLAFEREAAPSVSHRLHRPLIIASAAVGIFGLVLGASGSAALGQLSAVLSLSCGALAALGFFVGEIRSSRALPMVFPATLLALWCDAYAYLDVPPKGVTFFLFGCAIAAPALGSRRRLPALLPVGLSAVFLAVGIIVAFSSEPTMEEAPDPLEDLYRSASPR